MCFLQPGNQYQVIPPNCYESEGITLYLPRAKHMINKTSVGRVHRREKSLPTLIGA